MNPQALWTEELVQQAVKAVIPSFERLGDTGAVWRGHLCVVILKPYIHPEFGKFEDCILYIHQVGEDWERPYDIFATMVAESTWRSRIPLTEAARIPLTGSSDLHGIVVACSGVEPHFAQALAESISAMCYAFFLNARIKASLAILKS